MELFYNFFHVRTCFVQLHNFCCKMKQSSLCFHKKDGWWNFFPRMVKEKWKIKQESEPNLFSNVKIPNL